MRDRRAVALVAVGFAIGAAFHALDFVHYGWWPYTFGPDALNLFWNALLPVDLAVVALLIWQPRIGLPAGAIVMIADVAANGYAWRVLGFDRFAHAVPAQATFGMFVIIVACGYRTGRPSTTG